ncbi:hypothetical protein K4B79_22975 [Streptomyces lincolnensis]|nr:hypothetical protein [Streptomyces lincolnensis]MCD7441076.1 hypothetical protein [Streptomyces lincolnensis]
MNTLTATIRRLLAPLFRPDRTEPPTASDLRDGPGGPDVWLAGLRLGG